jgi:hypothetical protein
MNAKGYSGAAHECEKTSEEGLIISAAERGGEYPARIPNNIIIIQRGGFYLRSPVPRRLAQTTLLWRIVKVGQTGLKRVPQSLRIVETFSSGIFLRNDDTR